MEPEPPPNAAEDLTAWEWSHLLDLPIDSIDDDVILPLSPPRAPPPPPPPLPQQQQQQQQQQQAVAGRVRKRDPRLLCENFLAGRLPCACPELDEAAEEEEEEDAGVGMAEKKRAKRGGGGAASFAAPARCQVPGCKADISELKGYHRRHRVCLRCANACSVLLEGEAKRYCQQCGRFHVLADFDEGKRSCRRKLERHNKRRRRRPTDNKTMVDKEKEVEGATDLDVLNGEQNKESTDRASFESDSLCIDDKTTDVEGLVDSEGHGSPYCSEPSIRTGHSNNIVSCAVSSDTVVEERLDNPKSVISSFSENKRTYSSVCPTGRISFKLYDWNPAEFPRRLRLQILQWLASMPVELEGYLRPGCTILTIFIAMPQSMWNRLSNDTARYLHNFFKDPQNLFFGRGNIHMYLNNTLYQVLADGTSLANVKMEVQVPRLHYVHPLFFEAGKPVEFIACGSNLLQPKFRFLVSFGGKYLAGETSCAISYKSMRYCCDIEESKQDCEHQTVKINFPSPEAEALGPAFVEVENECGLSNFIPVLFADKYICSELQRMQESHGFDPISPKVRETGAISSLCKVHVSRQSKISELLLDIAWLLRQPQMEEDGVFFSTVNIQRVNNLLNHLIQSNSVNTLWKVLCRLDSHLERFKSQEKLEISTEGCSSNVDLLERCMNNAKLSLQKKSWEDAIIDLNPEILATNNVLQSDDKQHWLEAVPGVWDHVQGEVEVMAPVKQNRSLSFECKDESHPLLDGLLPQKGSDSCGMQIKWPVWSWDFSRKVITPRLLILVMASIFICCGLCAALLHPHMARRMMVSSRRKMYRWLEMMIIYHSMDRSKHSSTALEDGLDPSYYFIRRTIKVGKVWIFQVITDILGAGSFACLMPWSVAVLLGMIMARHYLVKFVGLH